MPKSELEIVEDLIRSGPDMAGMAPAELRAAFDEIGNATPPPDDVVFEHVSAGGIPAEFGTSAGAYGSRTIMYFHGGGYVIGSLRSHRGLVARLGKAAGIRTLAVDYRLAPENPFPAAIDDAITAYRWLLAQGISPSSIAFAGDSAGGGLAVATMLRARDEKLPMPAAAVLFSPYTDMTSSGDSVVKKVAEDIMITTAIMRGMAAAYIGSADPRSPHASPIFADLTGLPPLFIQVGSAEMLLDDTLRLLRRAAIANVDVRVRVWPNLPHVWQLYAGILQEGRDALAEAGAFIAQHLN